MSFANSLWCEMESELTLLRERDCREISAWSRSNAVRLSETFSAIEEMSSERLESSSKMGERKFHERCATGGAGTEGGEQERSRMGMR